MDTLTPLILYPHLHTTFTIKLGFILNDEREGGRRGEEGRLRAVRGEEKGRKHSVIAQRKDEEMPGVVHGLAGFGKEEGT